MSNLKALKKEIISNFNSIVESLDQHFKNTSGPLTEIWGVDAVPVTADDLRYKAKILGNILDSTNFDRHSKIDDNDNSGLVHQILNDIKNQTNLIKEIYVRELFNDVNSHKSIISTLSFIEFFLSDIQRNLGFPDLLSLNAQAKRRYDRLLETVSKVEDEAANLSDKSKTIIDAYNIAEDLPATSNELKKAKMLVDESLSDINLNKKEAINAVKEAQDKLSNIQELNSESESLMTSFRQKYAAFTSVGLAHSFALRAAERKKSVQKWTFLLICSLAICGFIGAERFPLLLQTLEDKTDAITILINMFYGFLSMAPAIWLAWISSAHIGMNYRISEDYNYKSTLASSYEGFRSEAIRIDPYLEAKLFMIAMERLDEIPLRFVDPTVKNSPLHELISSEEFKKVVETNDELKLRVITIIKSLKDLPKDMIEYIESLKK